MRFPQLLILPLLATIASCAPQIESSGCGADFEKLLVTLAEAWNGNDATLAASLFHDNAVYEEPHRRQLHEGKDTIFAFFGGPEGRDSWMRMDWHHIAFNEEAQTGAGEFTFSWQGGQVHGMASIQLRDGRIFRWREYFYASDLTWEAFSRASAFAIETD